VSMQRGRPESVALAQPKRAVACFAETRRVGEKSAEHRREFAGRASDDLEDLGCGSLLLQRFPEFVEQARILDGDDGLRGEVLNQLDLLLGEWPHLLAIESDHTNQLVILQHRHTKYSSEFAEFNRGDDSWITVAVGLKLADVSYVRDLFGGHSATN